MDLLDISTLLEIPQPQQLNNWSLVGQFFSSLLLLGIILVAFYFLAKVVASYRYKGNKNSNIKIIESIGIGYQSMIQLIEVGNKIILIGVTKDKITFLCEVDKDSIKEGDLNSNTPDSFRKYLETFINKNNDSTKK